MPDSTPWNVFQVKNNSHFNSSMCCWLLLVNRRVDFRSLSIWTIASAKRSLDMQFMVKNDSIKNNNNEICHNSCSKTSYDDRLHVSSRIHDATFIRSTLTPNYFKREHKNRFKFWSFRATRIIIIYFLRNSKQLYIKLKFLLSSD
jgi:hypothetical protein